VRVIDPAPAVAAQVARLYRPLCDGPEVDIHSSGDESFAKAFWHLRESLA